MYKNHCLLKIIANTFSGAKSKKMTLGWGRRLKIAVDAAKGTPRYFYRLFQHLRQVKDTCKEVKRDSSIELINWFNFDITFCTLVNQKCVTLLKVYLCNYSSMSMHLLWFILLI